MDFQSGWPEERQHWEVELSDDTGSLDEKIEPRAPTYPVKQVVSWLARLAGAHFVVSPR